MASNPAEPGDDGAKRPIDVQSAAEFDAILDDGGLVLVDFYADWCGPCNVLAPRVERLASEVDNPVVKLDVEALPDVATRYDVKAIPTLIVFEESVPVERLRGVQEKAVLADALDQ
jgi:thioredoxin 1